LVFTGLSTTKLMIFMGNRIIIEWILCD
jgi:hypothetical protein